MDYHIDFYAHDIHMLKLAVFQYCGQQMSAQKEHVGLLYNTLLGLFLSSIKVHGLKVFRLLALALPALNITIVGARAFDGIASSATLGAWLASCEQACYLN